MITDRNELIEAYINNKLSPNEVSSFEETLAKDSTLQNEVKLQRDIVNTIKETRRMELKNRLSSIEVRGGMSTSQKVGITAVALSALLLLSFGLYEFNKDTTILEGQTKEVLSTQPETNTSASTEVKKMEEVKHNSEDNTINQPQATKSTPTSEKDTPKENTLTSGKKSSNLTMPTPLDFEAEGSGIEHDALNTPTDNYSDNEKNEIRAITPKIDNKDKKVKMYRYDGENLTLIGDFNSTEPYHLIERPKKHKSELYLKFENTYYIITETKKATVLEEVTNKELISELSKK